MTTFDPTTHKPCAVCGTPFKRSPADRTVNCPAHRESAASKPATGGRAKDPRAPYGAKCTIPGCGRPAVVRVPGTDYFECETHAPRGSF